MQTMQHMSKKLPQSNDQLKVKQCPIYHSQRTYCLYCIAKSAKYFLLLRYTLSLNPCKNRKLKISGYVLTSSSKAMKVKERHWAVVLEFWTRSIRVSIPCNSLHTGWSAFNSEPYIKTLFAHKSNSEIFLGNQGTSVRSITQFEISRLSNEITTKQP